MKNIVITTMLCITAFKMSSQNTFQLINHDLSTVLAPDATIHVTTQAETNSKVTIDIKNISSSVQSYNVTRYDDIINANATSTALAYYCMASYCYGPETTASPNPLVLQPGQSASQLQGEFQMLIADLDEATTVGLSKVRYEFEGSSKDKIAITIIYNDPSNPTGIRENDHSTVDFTIYPNPVVGTVNLRIISQQQNNVTLQFYNLLGESVLKKQLQINPSSNVAPIDVSQLPAGIYYADLNIGSRHIVKKIQVL